MATFSAEVYQNEFLPEGGTDVHAIVTVTCRAAGEAGRAGGAAEIIIIDTSRSMGVAKMEAARQAAHAALDQVLDGVWFAVISGSHVARVAYPLGSHEMPMVRMDARTRRDAKAAVTAMSSAGGTAIGTWLHLAAELFAGVPGASQRHAILLTDGKNQHETEEELALAIDHARGRFQCDCRGVGQDWAVAELRRIATALLGTVGLIPRPGQMVKEFESIMRRSMLRGVPDVRLRIWAPQGAEVMFVRQVSPEVDELTHLRQDVNALTGAYPTGSWGDESRDYHVSVRLPARTVGQEQLAARVQVVVGDEMVAQGLVKALWSDDSTLTTRISPAVAHYTGQAELAEVIQEGLAAKAAGDVTTATAKLGRAVQLARDTGNDEATSRLRKVVEVDDAVTGRVRLRKDVSKLDEMALDTASTKTTRVRR